MADPITYATCPQEALDRIGYRELAPIGTKTVYAHQNRGHKPHTWGDIEVDAYPESPEGVALRTWRVESGIGQREAARSLGIDGVRYGYLERGRAICNWQVVRELV